MKAQRHEGTKARIQVLTPGLTSLRGRPGFPRAFSLIEVLLAIFILGIGVIGIAALFPAGIAQQQRSVDDVMGPVVANNALSILRSKLSQDDFGSFEDLGFNIPPEYVSFASGAQIPGDWLWRRPAIMYQDDPATNDRDERGAIDIFGFVGGAAANGFWDVGNASLNNVDAAADQTAFISGTFPQRPIPFNPAKWFNPSATVQQTPSMVITQGERMYPMAGRMSNIDNDSAPQYYWDCMFRKFQGKVLVAIFVYRIVVPGGEDYTFSVPAHPDGTGVPIVPHHLSLADITASMPWDGQPNQDALDATGQVPDSDYPLTAIWETDPTSPYSGSGPWSNIGPSGQSEPQRFAALDRAWQVTGQWFIDQNNNIHRVLVGREKDDTRPVELVDHIAGLPQPNAYSFTSVYFYDRQPTFGNVGANNIVTDIWYLPRYVEVPVGGTTMTISIIPIFATVEEL